ncbi:MAG: DUF4252 domain-containing protein [Flavobacteriaceae bacterium]|jgi:hypothetical protein|nr:DUF4252 domain-containing protein [Flavobacteriaceae bacterium]
MKTHIISILCLLLLQSCIISKQPNIAFFDNPYYDFGDAEFTSVNVPVWLAKPFVAKALREDGESEEVIALIKKIKKIRVLTVENGDKKMLADFSKYLNQNQYEDWVTVVHDGNKVNIQVLQDGEKINKLMLLVSENHQFVFVDIKGKFTAEDISNVVNAATNPE